MEKKLENRLVSKYSYSRSSVIYTNNIGTVYFSFQHSMIGYICNYHELRGTLPVANGGEGENLVVEVRGVAVHAVADDLPVADFLLVRIVGVAGRALLETNEPLREIHASAIYRADPQHDRRETFFFLMYICFWRGFGDGIPADLDSGHLFCAWHCCIGCFCI